MYDFCMSNKMNANNLNFIEDLSSFKSMTKLVQQIQVIKKA